MMFPYSLPWQFHLIEARQNGKLEGIYSFLFFSISFGIDYLK